MTDLVLILASQRVGSTYFERGLQHMGGLGRPFEVFARVTGELASLRDPDAMRALFEERLALGRTEPDGRVGMTLMANYFGLVAGAYLGRMEPKRRYDVSHWLEFWDVFRPRFDRVVVFYLTRDPLDQALSQLFSEETRLTHLVDGVRVRIDTEVLNGSVHGLERIEGPPRMTHAEAIPSISPSRILRRIDKLCRENATLEAFIAAAGLNALRVDYADSTSAPAETARRIAEHADGLAASLQFTPDTMKVLSQDASERVKDNLARYLGLAAAARAKPGALSAAAVAAATERGRRPWQARHTLRDVAWWMTAGRKGGR